MRFIQIFVLPAFTLAMLIACKKSAMSVQADGVMGKWELRQSLSGSGSISYAPGNGNRYEFSSSGYAWYNKGNIVEQGNYKIVTDDSAEQKIGLLIPAGQFRQKIELNDSLLHGFFFQLNGNQLTLLSGFFPADSGVESVYERQ